jgi:hypothetical protein
MLGQERTRGVEGRGVHTLHRIELLDGEIRGIRGFRLLRCMAISP